MNACREWVEPIIEYVDNRCPPETAHRLEVHLQTCSSCARVVEQQRWVKQALLQVEKELAPADMSRRIRHHARASVRRMRTMHLVRRLTFASMLLLATVVVWWTAARSPRPSVEEPSLAQAVAQEYVGMTSSGGFSDPSLQLLDREARMQNVHIGSVLP